MKPNVIRVGHDECVVNTPDHVRMVDLDRQRTIEQAQEECSESGATILGLHGHNRPVVIEGETGLPVEPKRVHPKYSGLGYPSEAKEFEPLEKWTEEE